MSNKTTTMEKFNPALINTSDVKEGNGKQPQNVAFINYNGGERLELQTPPIKLTSGGIPNNSDFHPTQKSRCMISIPLDGENSVEMKAKMMQMDDRMSSDEIKTVLFGPKKSKYELIRSVREPTSDDGPPRPPTMKVRISATFEDTEPVITTEVFTSVTGPNGKIRTKEKTDTLEEFSKHVPFLGTARYIIRPIKVWISKQPPPGSKQLTYGVTWGVKGVDVIDCGNKTQKNTPSEFLDSDDDEEIQLKPPPPTTSTTKNVADIIKNKPRFDDDEEEEDEEDEEDEEEEEEEEEEEAPPPPPPKKNKSTTKTKKIA
jgi:hypothetical protein